MQLEQAKVICERWFAYLDMQRDHAYRMAVLATRVREGLITSQEAQRQVKIIDMEKLRVYDAAQLEQAVKFLLKQVSKNVYPPSR